MSPQAQEHEDRQLRCVTLHGILKSNGLLEIKCHHIKCTKGRAVNVFHYFDPRTGRLVDTKEFKDPFKPKDRRG